MNKLILLAFSAFVLTSSCSRHKDEQIISLQHSIDSLQQNAYRPGLGEFMSGIQVHHAKLWFAGTAGNWPLAEFELGEIRETVEDIRKYAGDRKEVKTIDMINAPLVALDSAISHKNAGTFKESFTLLTATCNNCHKTNDFSFNVIKIPDAVPVPNQVFAPQQ